MPLKSRYEGSKCVELRGEQHLRWPWIPAVSELRQKQAAFVVRSCKNLVACHGVAPDSKLEWAVKEELMDIYSVFVAEVGVTDDAAALQVGLSSRSFPGYHKWRPILEK